MREQKKIDYNTIIPRGTAIAICFFGMLELLVATCIIVCAFVLFGGFCNQLSCEEISDAIGLWLGFPLIVPALLGVVVLGTRHKAAVVASLLTNFIGAALAIVHVIITKRDDDDVWSKYVKLFNDDKCKIEYPLNCRCDGTVLVFGCELIEFGSDLNMILFGLSIAAIVLCAVSALTSIIGLSKLSAKARR